ncbi:MAG: hypothetical protein ACYTGB_12030 [Planctomycetota bacterium]
MAAVLLLALAAAGCSAPRGAGRRERVVPEGESYSGLVPREGAGPFWSWEESATGHLTYRGLHPLIAGESKPGRRVFAFRPLFSHEDEGPGSTRWKFRALWPLVLLERDDDSHRFRIFPVVWERDRSKLDGKVHDRDFWVLPFLWTGSDTEEGGYFALWPAGGMVKGVFGKKYIRFFLWPLWVEAQDKNYHSWNCPWPVFGVWRGPDQRGWRFWPFMGVNSREGKFRRMFFMSGLGQWWDTNLDTDAPGKVRSFLPAWGMIDNKHQHHVTVLWPLFSRRHNRQMDVVEWHAPWPVFSRTVGPGLRGVKFWPLYHHRFAPNHHSRSFGWKLYHREVVQGNRERTTKISSCLFFQYIRDEWVEKKVSEGLGVSRDPPPLPRHMARLAAERAGLDPDVGERKFREMPEGVLKSRVNTLLWPLFRYKRNEKGERFITVLEPWFWRDTEVWDRHYGPFVTLYRYRRTADGAVLEQGLFNLYEHYRSPTERRVRFSPVFDYWRRGVPAEYKRFRIVGGLFGYERRGRAKRVRILWIPIGRRPAGWK